VSWTLIETRMRQRLAAGAAMVAVEERDTPAIVCGLDTKYTRELTVC